MGGVLVGRLRANQFRQGKRDTAGHRFFAPAHILIISDFQLGGVILPLFEQADFLVADRRSSESTSFGSSNADEGSRRASSKSMVAAVMRGLPFMADGFRPSAS